MTVLSFVFYWLTSGGVGDEGRCGKKKIVLELGGNAAVVVDPDTHQADAVERIIIGASYQSGQSCVGVQRIILTQSMIHSRQLMARTKQLKSGDPKHEQTFIGPMISERGHLLGKLDEGSL